MPLDAVLYVNDTPDERDGHAHHYDAAGRHVIAVSFVAASRRCTRISFDPRTGDFSAQIYDEDGSR